MSFLAHSELYTKHRSQVVCVMRMLTAVAAAQQCEVSYSLLYFVKLSTCMSTCAGDIEL